MTAIYNLIWYYIGIGKNSEEDAINLAKQEFDETTMKYPQTGKLNMQLIGKAMRRKLNELNVKSKPNELNVRRRWGG